MISILAGATTRALTGHLGHREVVRSMPNTPAQLGKGMPSERIRNRASHGCFGMPERERTMNPEGRNAEMSPTTVRQGPGWVLTIEFGDEHTFAAVAHPGRGNAPVRLGADRDSHAVGVFVGPREMLAGERAAVAGRTEPDGTWPSRGGGSGTRRPAGQRQRGARGELVAAVLRQVAWAATAGRGRRSRPPQVVLVRPGDWRPYQVGQLEHAARMAGLGPVRHVFEPPAGPIPAGPGSSAGSDRVGGVGPGRRSRRRTSPLVVAATGWVAVLAAGAGVDQFRVAGRSPGPRPRRCR